MKALVLTLALLAIPAAAVAGDWVYPSTSVRGADGIERYPTTDGRLFDSIFEREAYLRGQRDAARQARRMERAAGPVPEPAGSGKVRQRQLPLRSADPGVVLYDPILRSVAPSGDAATDQRRLDEALARARAQRDFQRRRDTLSAISRGDRAATRSDIAAARAAGQQRTARGADRLQSGAAAGRATLGERETRPRGPLIRMPKVSLP